MYSSLNSDYCRDSSSQRSTSEGSGGRSGNKFRLTSRPENQILYSWRYGQSSSNRIERTKDI